MTTLVWNAVGERRFEVGVDRGVLYIDGNGVPWNGLVSVSESSSGGDVKPYYIDGVRYLNHAELEEFEATIEAYTYPEEFALCDGTAPVANGLFVTQQTKKSFGLSYRTRVGNDVDGTDHAYKIHLVYGAMAEPSDRSHDTMSESIDPFHFSWRIQTKPERFKGYKPTSHFVIDSREVPVDLMKQVNDILYGSDTSSARLPSVAELLFIFTEYETSVFDAGHLSDEYFAVFDAGEISDPYTSTIDGGTP